VNAVNKIKFLLLGIGIGIILGYFATSYAIKEIYPSSDVQVIPVVDRNYMSVVEEEIKNSNKFIHVVMFQTGYQGILKDLVDAKKRGVEVKVLLEGGEDYLGEDFRKKSIASSEYLKKNGVEVKFDESGTTTHAKFLVTESSVIVGSTNWSYSAIYKNNEANVLIRSKSMVDFFEKYFNEKWNKGL